MRSNENDNDLCNMQDFLAIFTEMRHISYILQREIYVCLRLSLNYVFWELQEKFLWVQY